MQHQPTDRMCARKASIEPFFVSLRRVAFAWLIGFAALMAVTCYVDSNWLTLALVISVASGLVAVVSLCPLILFASDPKKESGQQDESSRQASGDLVSAFMLGTVLRLFGTVALFLLCRYQLGQQLEAIAVLVGGWYVLLTSVEVISLAKTNAAMHRSRTNCQIWTTG